MLDFAYNYKTELEKTANRAEKMLYVRFITLPSRNTM